MQKLDYWIHRQLRRLRFGVFLGRAAEYVALFLLAFGAVVLVCKLWLPWFWPHVLWGGCGVIPVFVLAWWTTRDERYQSADAAVILDEKLKTGGLLLSLAETNDPHWERKLPKKKHLWRESILKLHPARFGRLVAFPLIFAIGACLIPPREAQSKGVLPKSVGRRTAEQLHSMLDWLDEAHVLAEDESKDLREEVGKLEQDLKNQAITHEKWETIDSLREQLLRRVDTAERLISKAQQAVATLASAANEGKPLTVERKNQLQEDVLETLRKLKQRGAFTDASQQFSGELQRLVKQNQFRLPNDLAARLNQLESLQKFLDQQAKSLSQCRGRCQGGTSANGLEQTDGAGGSLAGKGGITRGPGAAELTFGKESDEKLAKFKQIVLPPGFLDDPTNSKTETRSVAPETNPTATAKRGSQQEFDSATGREARTRSLRPRHRQAVRDYFGNRPEEKPKTD